MGDLEGERGELLAPRLAACNIVGRTARVEPTHAGSSTTNTDHTHRLQQTAHRSYTVRVQDGSSSMQHSYRHGLEANAINKK